jgi:hypothetical protein
VVHCGNGFSGHQRAKNPLYRGQKIFHSNRPIWVSKTSNFKLISKMFTYHSDKMHPKNVLGKKLFSEKIVPKNLLLGQNFF